MISRYVFRVQTQETLPNERAYAFYSCLLSLLPGDYAEELHAPKETPISQCLYRKNTETLWKISLLDQTTYDVYHAVLDDLNSLPLNTGETGLALLETERLTAEQLIEKSRAITSDRFFSLNILSPTAFKQNGKYTVLPEKNLILQSLVKKWNAAFSSVPLEDEDAMHLLSDGIRISDYQLRTTRFLLKDNKIPGFIGSLRIDTHLSAPMMELWRMLLAFSEYSGIGIKTALGMGGVALR